jgi:hypothetical protein
MCLSDWSKMYVGKQGYPTISFNFVVDSNVRCQSISDPFPDARNEKTMVRFDPFIKMLQCDPRFSQQPWNLNSHATEKTVVSTRRGLYMMCDGGYHKWSETISGVNIARDEKFAAFSVHLQSHRKDVECFFGRLKKRFVFCRRPRCSKT